MATDEINYRRFFDINDLAGLAMEDPELFEISHRLIFQLIAEGKIQPLLSRTYQLEETGEAALAVHRNEIEGKAGVLCLAPEKGLGIDDPEFREKVGEDKITLFRRHA